jgi:hypothetical protein
MGLVVHVVARSAMLQPPLAATLRDCIQAQAQAGHEVRVVLLHDAVARSAWVRAIPEVAGVHPRAEDCRRRALPVPADALEDAEIVARLAAAERVASW